MTIVEKKVSELIPYGNNPRRNDEAVQYVANSIKEFGFKVPIVIDADGVIVAGHTRLKAAKKLGLKTVPCVVADDLTPEQVKAFRLADNKTAEMADWDYGMLELELDDIVGIDMGDFGFLDGEIEAGEAEEKPENPYTRKVNLPQYEPTGAKVGLSDLADTAKYERLCEAVDGSSLPDGEKQFLKLAAARHIVFDYKNIAEYYAQASEEVQALMEDSALVIIDVEDAIAKGYAVLKASIEGLAFGGDGND